MYASSSDIDVALKDWSEICVVAVAPLFTVTSRVIRQVDLGHLIRVEVVQRDRTHVVYDVKGGEVEVVGTDLAIICSYGVLAAQESLPNDVLCVVVQRITGPQNAVRAR